MFIFFIVMIRIYNYFILFVLLVLFLPYKNVSFLINWYDETFGKVNDMFKINFVGFLF